MLTGQTILVTGATGTIGQAICHSRAAEGARVVIDAPLPEWQAVWEREFRANFLSAVDLTRAAILHFRAQGGGAIVNTASQWGLYPAPNHIACNVTKAAVA